MSTFALENPNTGQSEETFPRFDDSDRDALLDRASTAFDSWRRTSIDERAAVLAKTAELYREKKTELADIIGREMGKLQRWGEAEVDIVADIYDWFAEHAHELLAPTPLPAQSAQQTYVVKDPIGPLLGIMPWNFPYYQVARWAAPNLLLGNTLILKHASICPLSSQACQDILEEAGLPKDVFTNVYASGSQMDDFVADPRIAGVSLTGSEGAGAAVAKTAGEHYKKSVLELGGNDPFVVIDDTNLDWVLEQFTKIRMYNTGQACNAPKRLIVLDSFYDRTVEKLTELIGGMTVGAYDSDSSVGPLSSIDARDEIVQRLSDASEAGEAKIVVGGKALDRDGAYMEPTLLTDVDPSSDTARNEIFGPVAMVFKASSVDEAVEIANDSDYGLAASVWGSDLDQAHEVARRLEAGMSFVNEASVTAAGLPFGGIGRSGYGRELERWGVGEFVNDKLIRVSDQSSAGLSPAM